MLISTWLPVSPPGSPLYIMFYHAQKNKGLKMKIAAADLWNTQKKN
jgi:hypothetical protein